MSLTYGLEGPADLFRKVERDAQLLADEVTPDHFFNFVVTAYSLVDWVMNDPKQPAVIRGAAAAMRNDRWIRLCGDMATASKHFAVTRRKLMAQSTNVEHGYGSGRYGKGPYGIGEAAITVELDDGRSVNALEVAQGAVQSWRQFVTAHGIDRPAPAKA